MAVFVKNSFNFRKLALLKKKWPLKIMRKIGKMAVFVKIGGHCGQKKWPLKMLKMGVFGLFLGVFGLFLGVFT